MRVTKEELKQLMKTKFQKAGLNERSCRYSCRRTSIC